MARQTPVLNVKGRFLLKAPWSANPNILYTCISLRTFDDIYKFGTDVYKTFYEAMGVTSGSVTFTPQPFDFQKEKKDGVLIVTLKGDDNSVIYVPDSFIDKQADNSEVVYSHIVLSASLSILPDTTDLTALKTSLAAIIQGAVGVATQVKEMRLPTDNNPTKQEHNVLEAVRRGSITLLETDKARANRLQSENTLLQAKIATLVQILKDNNLLPN